jgi:aconitase A
LIVQIVEYDVSVVDIVDDHYVQTMALTSCTNDVFVDNALAGGLASLLRV